MFTTVEALYKNGRIELAEPFPSKRKVKVLVTFLGSQKKTPEVGQPQKNIAVPLARLRAKMRHIPATRLLSEEIVTERRREAND